jgi:hypothetical protein
MINKLILLIPTYNFVEGVDRILKKIYLERKLVFKTYIFDNSSTSVIRNVYFKYKEKGLDIEYNYSPPRLSAQNNWSNLIRYVFESLKKTSNFSKFYFILLHQDDVPEDNFFFSKLHRNLQKNHKEVISLNTIINDKSFFDNRLHTENYLRYFLYKYFPKYIFLRNYFGPISSLVFKSTLFIKRLPQFKNKLQWLIDIEFYNRYLSNKKIFFSNLSVKSLLYNNIFSLTSSLVDKRKLQMKELKFLNKNQKKSYIILDFTFWYSIRTIQYLKYILFKKIW